VLALPAPGTGEPHRVVFNGRVPVRKGARQDAQVIGSLTPGEEVELFTEDHTGQWRSLVCFTMTNFSRTEKRVLPGFGWVLVHSDVHGQLLEKGRGKLKHKGSALQDEGEGEPPLLVAVRSGSVNETIRLLWTKADVNTADILGDTALIEAASAGSLNMLLVLLLARADPAHRTESGMTALALAKDPGYRALLTAFAERGRRLDDKQRGDLDKALEGPAPTPLVEATKRRLFGGGEVEDDATHRIAQLAVDKDEMMRRLMEENEKLRNQLEQDHQDVKQGPKPEMLDRQQEQQLVPVVAETAEGELFRVVFRGGKMAVREEPMQTAKVISTMKAGDEVHLLEADETGNWRKVICTCLHFKDLPGSSGPGWVLLRSEKLGTLLEKAD